MLISTYPAADSDHISCVQPFVGFEIWESHWLNVLGAVESATKGEHRNIVFEVISVVAFLSFKIGYKN